MPTARQTRPWPCSATLLPSSARTILISPPEGEVRPQSSPWSSQTPMFQPDYPMVQPDHPCSSADQPMVQPNQPRVYNPVTVSNQSKPVGGVVNRDQPKITISLQFRLLLFSEWELQSRFRLLKIFLNSDKSDLQFFFVISQFEIRIDYINFK